MQFSTVDFLATSSSIAQSENERYGVSGPIVMVIDELNIYKNGYISSDEPLMRTHSKTI